MRKALLSEEITVRCVQHVAFNLLPDLTTAIDESVRYVINYVIASWLPIGRLS